MNIKILAEQITDILRFTRKSRGSSIAYTMRKLDEFDYDTRKDERQKIADQVRAMKIDEITDAGTIADAILEGGK